MIELSMLDVHSLCTSRVVVRLLIQTTRAHSCTQDPASEPAHASPDPSPARRPSGSSAGAVIGETARIDDVKTRGRLRGTVLWLPDDEVGRGRRRRGGDLEGQGSNDGEDDEDVLEHDEWLAECLIGRLRSGVGKIWSRKREEGLAID